MCPAEGGPAEEFIGHSHTKPHWTPDGKWVLSDETRKGWDRSLNFVRISDKKEFRLTPPVKTGIFVSLSPSGDWILFNRLSHHLMWGMKVASASGGPSFEPVAHLPVYGAQWSANSKIIIVQGKPLAYCITPDHKRVLFVTKKDGDETDDFYMASISIEEARVTGAPTIIWFKFSALLLRIMSHICKKEMLTFLLYTSELLFLCVIILRIITHGYESRS